MKCPCGMDRAFDACCGPLLDGERAAGSPEALMRSRYVAYGAKRLDYVLDTTDPQHRADVPADMVRAWMDEAEFTGLTVLRAEEQGPKGLVEFIARYVDARGAHEHHEVSRFRKRDGRWYFREGRVVQS